MGLEHTADSPEAAAGGDGGAATAAILSSGAVPLAPPAGLTTAQLDLLNLCMMPPCDLPTHTPTSESPRAQQRPPPPQQPTPPHGGATTSHRGEAARARTLTAAQRAGRAITGLDWVSFSATHRLVENAGHGDCFFHSLLDGDTLGSLQFDVAALRLRVSRIMTEYLGQSSEFDAVTGAHNAAYTALHRLITEPGLAERMTQVFAARPQCPHTRSSWLSVMDHSRSSWTPIIDSVPEGLVGSHPTPDAMRRFIAAYRDYLLWGGYISLYEAGVLAALVRRAVVLYHRGESATGPLQAVVLGLPSVTLLAARQVLGEDGAASLPNSILSSATSLTIHCGLDVLPPSAPDIIEVFYEHNHFRAVLPRGVAPVPRSLSGVTYGCPAIDCPLLFQDPTTAMSHGSACHQVADCAGRFPTPRLAAAVPTSSSATGILPGLGPAQAAASTTGTAPAAAAAAAGKKKSTGKKSTASGAGAGAGAAAAGMSPAPAAAATPRGRSPTRAQPSAAGKGSKAKGSKAPKPQHRGSAPIRVGLGTPRTPAGRRRAPSPDADDPGLLPGVASSVSWLDLEEGEGALGTTLMALPMLRHILSSLPFDRLHLPHTRAATVAELFAWWSPKRSRGSLTVERQLIRAQTLVLEVLAAALGSSEADTSAEDGASPLDDPPVPTPPSVLECPQAYALFHLFPALMLQHSSSSTIAVALSRRLWLWQQGSWLQLFADAGLLSSAVLDASGGIDADGAAIDGDDSDAAACPLPAVTWKLGNPGPAAPRPDDAGRAPDARPGADATDTGHTPPLATEPLPEGMAPISTSGQFTTQQASRAIRLIRTDELSRAATTLRPVPRLDPGTPAVAALLRDLHPHSRTGQPIRVGERPTFPHTSTAAAEAAAAAGHAAPRARVSNRKVLSPAAVTRALRRCPRGSASGPDGWRFEHLKLAVSKAPELATLAPRMLKALVAVMIAVALGRLPSTCRDAFATAAVSALQKASTTPQLKARPLAAGNVLRRLVSMALAFEHVSDLRTAGGPYQVAIGRSSAAEGVCLAVRQALLDIPGAHCATWDARNAFNQVDRQHMLDEVAAEVPALYAYVSFVYGGLAIPLSARSSSTTGEAGDTGYLVIQSAEGVQQGDPLGPALFAIAMSSSLREIHRRLTACAVGGGAEGPAPAGRPLRFVLVAYLDDISLVAPARLIRAALHHVPLVLRRSCGLEINQAKTQVWPPMPPPYIEAPSTLYSDSDDLARWTAALAAGMRGGGLARSHGIVPASAAVPEVMRDHRRERGSLAAVATGVVGGSTVLAPCHADHWPLVPWSPRTDDCLYSPDEFYSDPIPADAGLVLLGTPIGTVEWERAQVELRMDAVAEADLPMVGAFAMCATEALQCALLLLVRCIFPRVAYLLRTVHPGATLCAARRFDLAFRRTLAAITEIPWALLTDPASPVSIAASLACRLGGLQWRRAADLADVAYVSGIASGSPVAALLFPWPSAPPRPALTASHPPAASSPSLTSVPLYRELGVEEAHLRLLTSLRADDGLDAAGLAARADTRVTTSEARIGEALQSAFNESACITTAPPCLASPSAPGPVGSLHLQRALSQLLELMAQGRLRASMSLEDADHLHECAQRGAYEAFTLTPITSELTLAAPHLRVAIARRLRLPVLSASRPGMPSFISTGAGRPCSACVRAKKRVVELMDDRATHAFTSQCWGRHRVHDRVAAVFAQAAQAAGWPVYPATAADEIQEASEKTLAERSAAAHGGPISLYVAQQCDWVMVGCLSVTPPSGAIPINTDTVVTAVEPCEERIALRRAGNVAAKRKKHTLASQRAGHHFVPIELSSLGGIGVDGLNLLRRMADAVAAQSTAAEESWRQEQFLSYWVRRVSVAMQQACGDMIAKVAIAFAGGPYARAARLHAYPAPSIMGGPGCTDPRDYDSGVAAFARALRAAYGTRAGRF